MRVRVGDCRTLRLLVELLRLRLVRELAKRVGFVLALLTRLQGFAVPLQLRVLTGLNRRVVRLIVRVGLRARLVVQRTAVRVRVLGNALRGELRPEIAIRLLPLRVQTRDYSRWVLMKSW